MEFATGGTLRDLIKKNAAAAPAGRAARRRRRRDRRPGGDSRGRHRPPRRQARQHAAHGGRPPRAVRLRPRDRSPRQHDGQRLRRHASLHGARGPRRRSGDHALRRLVPRRRPARDLLRQAPGTKRSARSVAGVSEELDRVDVVDHRARDARALRRDASPTIPPSARKMRAPSSELFEGARRSPGALLWSRARRRRVHLGRGAAAIARAWQRSALTHRWRDRRGAWPVRGAPGFRASSTPGEPADWTNVAKRSRRPCPGTFTVSRSSTQIPSDSSGELRGRPRTSTSIRARGGLAARAGSLLSWLSGPVTATRRELLFTANTPAGGDGDTAQRERRRERCQAGHARLGPVWLTNGEEFALQHRCRARRGVLAADDEVSPCSRTPALGSQQTILGKAVSSRGERSR